MSESGKQALLLIAIVVCLVLVVQPNALAALVKRPEAPRRVLSQAEMQLFTTTANSGEIVMVGANGVLIDQGSQAVRVGTSNITLLTNNAERIRVDNSGNVGIGTTNAAAKLHVAGNALVSALDIGTVSVTSKLSITDSGLYRTIQSWEGGPLSINPAGNNVGIGTTNPGFPLQVNGRALIGHVPGQRKGIFIDNETAYGGFPCIQGVDGSFNASSIQINPIGGNVGIGTTNPIAMLHVAGTTVSGGNAVNVVMSNDGTGSGITLNNNAYSWFNAYSTTPPPNINAIARAQMTAYFPTRDGAYINAGASIQILDVNTNADYPTAIRGGDIAFFTMNGGVGQSGVPLGERMRINYAGNVGIGITNPGELLHVNNDNGRSYVAIQCSASQSCGIQFWRSGNQLSSIYHSHIDSDLRFYMPMVGTALQLYAGGGAWLAGSLTQSSDITLKKNIEVLPYGLETISRLNPVKYHFLLQDDSDKKHFGLIAQDVQQILPELVTTGDDGKLSLSYIELVPVLINAVKTQQRTISEQSRTISEQSRTISEQSRTIEDLTSRLSRVESLLSQLVR